ncbi:MAG: HlyD family efflux transporter periplasmic adaptor subunit [Methylotenera sp.]|nr:HlyD family efflux transporter periplasmic adaptor subunit [Flavobacterium sp.]
MNDTVGFKEGQIFSDTPQLKINAPNEAKVIKVLIKEGEEIKKGDILTIIAPKKEAFCAKVILDEKDLAYIKKGQEINLKLDAYNYYRFGAVIGKITYVSASDVEKTFYCLATI